MNRLIIILLLLSTKAFSQADTAQFPDVITTGDSIISRIVLVGDAGALVNHTSPVIKGIRSLIPMDYKTTIVFLGDNIYHDGLPDEQYSFYLSDKSVLDSQIALVMGTQARSFFIPGNHDWANGASGGYEAIVRQQRYVDRCGQTCNVSFFPKDGCPGPVKVDISQDVVLIMMDSQWWIHQEDKPGIESDCPQKTIEEVLVELDDLLAENDKKLVILACHHPFKSNGVHGGYLTLKQHISIH